MERGEFYGAMDFLKGQDKDQRPLQPDGAEEMDYATYCDAYISLNEPVVIAELMAEVASQAAARNTRATLRREATSPRELNALYCVMVRTSHYFQMEGFQTGEQSGDNGSEDQPPSVWWRELTLYLSGDPAKA